ncbi:MarR family winged helix-turn-helix transcriptional regulator [Schumannella luteola]
MRRSPTGRDLAIWREFVETGDRLRSTLSSRLQSESQLSSGDYAVLLALSEAEGLSIRSSDLAAAIGWERSRLSHHLGRMESRGLVRREACATDSRGAEVVLTETGASLFRSASVAHLRAVREVFLDALSPEQLDAIDDITRALREHLGNTASVSSAR